MTYFKNQLLLLQFFNPNSQKKQYKRTNKEKIKFYNILCFYS